MTEETKDVLGVDMIDKQLFEEVWKFITDKFGQSDQDLMQGYMICRAVCAIIEDAFKIENPPVVKVEGDDENLRG